MIREVRLALTIEMLIVMWRLMMLLHTRHWRWQRRECMRIQQASRAGRSTAGHRQLVRKGKRIRVDVALCHRLGWRRWLKHGGRRMPTVAVLLAVLELLRRIILADLIVGHCRIVAVVLIELIASAAVAGLAASPLLLRCALGALLIASLISGRFGGGWPLLFGR